MKNVRLRIIVVLVAGLLSCDLFLAPRKTATILNAAINGYVDDSGFRDLAAGTIQVRAAPGTRRSLVRFDGIPTDTTIYSAELRLGASGMWPTMVTAATMTAAWNAAAVTWAQAQAAAGESAAAEPAPQSGAVSFQAAPIVQAWADGEDNYGFVLCCTAGDIGFRTNEDTMLIGLSKPTLVIVHAEQPGRARPACGRLPRFGAGDG